MMSKREERPKVICIGASNIDRKALLKETITYNTSNPVITTSTFGGVARNVAENLARLQCDTDLISVFGEDQDGEQIQKHMDTLGINYHNSRNLKTSRTGTYTSINSPDGEMVLALADMEINEQFQVDWLKPLWADIALVSWVFLDTNLPADCLKWLLQQCAQNQIPLCLDPVSVPKVKKLPKCLNGLALFMPNLDEACAISGIPYQDEQSLEMIWKHLKNRGVQKLVLSLGEKGVFAATDTKLLYLPAQPVDVTEVTGAGDALVAGVLWGLLQNYSFEKACQFGIQNASLTLQTTETVCSRLTPTRLKKY